MNELRVRIPSYLMVCGGMVDTLECKSDFDNKTLVSQNEGIGVMVTHETFIRGSKSKTLNKEKMGQYRP